MKKDEFSNTYISKEVKIAVFLIRYELAADEPDGEKIFRGRSVKVKEEKGDLGLPQILIIKLS